MPFSEQRLKNRRRVKEQLKVMVCKINKEQDLYPPQQNNAIDYMCYFELTSVPSSFFEFLLFLAVPPSRQQNKQYTQ